MRTLVIGLIALGITLGGSLTPGSADAGPRYGYQGGSDYHPGYGKGYDHWNQWTLGEKLAWRDYRMHMQKHERIMERYGGGSYAVIDRPDTRFRCGDNLRHRTHRTTDRSRRW